MALDQESFLFLPNTVGFIPESTTGEYLDITEANCVTPIWNADFDFQGEVLDQQQSGASISEDSEELGAGFFNISFISRLYGKGAVGLPSWLPLLQACGFAAPEGGGQTLKPKTGLVYTLSFAQFLPDDRIIKARGGMGSTILTFERGKPIQSAWKYQAAYEAPEEGSLDNEPALDTVKPPICAEAEFTIDGDTYHIPKLEVAINNTLYLQESLVAGLGYHATLVTKRRIEWSLDPKSVGGLDWHSLYRSRATVPASILVGDTANNKITVASPKLQLIQYPKPGDRNSLMVDKLVFKALKDTPEGDDEISIALS
jgi:hypothetical protein